MDEDQDIRKEKIRARERGEAAKYNNVVLYKNWFEEKLS